MVQTTAASDGLTMLVFQISVPALANSCFQPNKLCRTVEEAKNFAAEHCLMQLGVGLGGEYGKYTPVLIDLPTTDDSYIKVKSSKDVHPKIMLSKSIQY